MAGNWPASWVRCSSSVNFYDLQIEMKVSLSLRNFVVALSVCVCVLSSTQVLHIPLLLGEVPIANVGGHRNKKQGEQAHTRHKQHLHH